MANTQKKEVPMQVRDPLGNIVAPMSLGVTLRDFTELAMAYVLAEDDGQNVGDCSGLERVAHTTQLAPRPVKVVQHLVTKPSRGKQKCTDVDRARCYRTINLPLWRDAHSCLDSLGFLKGDFCSPLGVHVASLLHGVEQCLGNPGVCAAMPPHVGVDHPCGWRKVPHVVNDYVLGRH